MSRAEANASILAQGMAKLLSGGLHVTDEPGEHPYEHAVMNIAAAQLRAINIAMMNPDPEQPEPMHGNRGWCRSGEEFTTHDAIAALGAVAMLLDVARDVLPYVREELEIAEKGGAR